MQSVSKDFGLIGDMNRSLGSTIMKRFGLGCGKPITEKPKSLASKEVWSEEGRLETSKIMENDGNSRRKCLNAGEKEIKWN